MLEGPDPFWKTDRINAAQLLADGELGDEDIAERCHRSRRWLSNLKARPEFQQRVSFIRDQTKAALLAKGILDRQNRLAALDDRQRRMQTVIEERAKVPAPRVERGEWIHDQATDEDKYHLYPADELPEIPGWSTGILVHQIKVGKDTAYDEYHVDTGLLSEMRATEKQAAQELGEWSEKRELTGKNGGPVQVSIQDLLLKAAGE